MGQRLNIEIKGFGGSIDNTLANAYFHWSGYTSSAAQLTLKVIEEIRTLKELKDRRLYAIKLLESTGARLTESEVDYASKTLSNFDANNVEIAKDRNSGLIAISDEGIHETRAWEEARVEIDLDEKLIDFDVVYYCDKDDFIEDYSKESFDLLENHNFNCDFRAIEFKDFPRIKSELLDLISNNIYSVKTYSDSEEVISFIE